MQAHRTALTSASLATLLLAAGALSHSAGATTIPDDDAGAGGGIVILDEGAETERVTLFGPMVAGTTAHSSQTSTVDGSIVATGSQNIDATISATTSVERSVEVVAVEEDGAYTLSHVVDSYEFAVASGPEDLAESFRTDEEFAPLVGVPLVQEYDADRNLLSAAPPSGTSLTDEQQAAIATMIEEATDPSAAFPDVPLGEGATWTSELPGVAYPLTAQFELTDVEGTVATITVSFDGDPASIGMAAPSGFDEVSGNLTGSGEYVVDTANPLEVSAQLDMTMDLAMSGDDIEMTMDLEFSMSQVASLT